MSLGKFAHQTYQKLFLGETMRHWRQLSEMERWGWETLADTVRRHEPNAITGISQIARHLRSAEAPTGGDDDAA